MESARGVICGCLLALVNAGCEIALEDVGAGGDAAPTGPIGTTPDAGADASPTADATAASDAGAGADAATVADATVGEDAAPSPPLPDPVAPDESAMPAWRKGLAVGAWTSIAGTALGSVPVAVKTYPTIGNTGPESKIIAWTSLALDTRDSSLYSPANGGHWDYAGNEVDRVRLSDDAPSWVEVRESSPPGAATANATHYTDGRPTSRHTYYGATVDETRGRVLIVGGALWGNGGSNPAMDGFSIASSNWDPKGTFPNAPTSFTSMPACALVEHPNTGDLYGFANWDVVRWKSSSNSWTTLLSGTNVYGQYAASALDSKRNRILIVGGVTSEHATYDIANNTLSSVTFTGSGGGVLDGDHNGLVYVPSLDAYLFRSAAPGGTVYRVDAATFQVSTFATTGGGSVPSAVNGVFRRFLYVPLLKGVVFAPSYNGNLWFLRTH